MHINRQQLLDIFDKFLREEISQQQMKDSVQLLVNVSPLEDDLIQQFLQGLSNETGNSALAKENMLLWKKRLIAEPGNLIEFEPWSSYLDNQRCICKTYGTIWTPVNPEWTLGVSEDLNNEPIHGLRHPNDRRSTKGTTGWFIWTGEYVDSADFFKPMCAGHLIQSRPDIIKYLGLSAGFRFLVDNAGYEDVWFDEELNKID